MYPDSVVMTSPGDTMDIGPVLERDEAAMANMSRGVSGIDVHDKHVRGDSLNTSKSPH